MKLVKKLDNLVSASDSGFNTFPINEGKWETLKWTVYLAGNSCKEDGQYNVRLMHTQTVFETAKAIIEIEKKELENCCKK